jgi:hypothetical protein
MENNSLDSVGLQPGDIVFTRENTLASWLIRLAQGDCDWSHVCLFAGDNIIHTTGAKHSMLYGTVNAAQYLRHKSFAVGRYHQATAAQRQQVLVASESLMGNLYPLWKVIRLALVGIRGRKVTNLGHNNPDKPKHTFCSEAVAYCYQQAGLNLAKKSKKTEPEVFTPESIFNDPNLNIIYE